MDPLVPVVSLVSSEGHGAEIRGFTITGGVRSGIFCASSAPVIRDNWIVGNEALGSGGGIRLRETQGALITGNRVFENFANSLGGGVHGQYGRGDTICYNVLYRNSGVGDLRVIGSTTQIYNNTISAGSSHGLIAYSTSGGIHVFNNVVVNATQSGITISGTSPVSATYNCTWNNLTDYYHAVPDDGAVDADPLFVDTANGNFRLRMGSPCIDAGDPDVLFNDPDGTRNDIGAIPCGSGNLSVSVGSGSEYGVVELVRTIDEMGLNQQDGDIAEIRESIRRLFNRQGEPPGADRADR